ncbi:MAG: hypothetical protein CMJ06_03335 [Pelagibacterales bacterium]|nr:hypothetical protein [Pelagibacterales bacterium]OUU62722.1 MAG: hypothetical protein CBC22_03580 [Alphaproteobacteria bacterium TMED62]|tara:strand:- start:1583 stop:2266 length:684 start_codon:yes stop_codon:yes gene_type:complete
MKDKIYSEIPILYSFRRCPFAMRARSAIYFSKVKVELREIALRQKPRQMLEISPKGTVPVLKLKNAVLEESIDIMLWALNINDKENLLCPFRENKKDNLNIINIFDNEFKYHLDRYKYNNRYINERKFISKEIHRDKGVEHLKVLEKLLLKNNSKYLYKNTISILDLALFPLIRQFKIADPSFFEKNIELTALNVWLTNLINTIFFKNIMYKYEVWNLNDAPIYFQR